MYQDNYENSELMELVNLHNKTSNGQASTAQVQAGARVPSIL